MHLALGNLNMNEPHKKNIEKALEKLATVVKSSSDAVSSFSSSTVGQQTETNVIKNSFPLDEVSVLEPNGIIDEEENEDKVSYVDKLNDIVSLDNEDEDEVLFLEDAESCSSNLLIKNEKKNPKIKSESSYDINNKEENEDTNNYNIHVSLEKSFSKSVDLTKNNKKNEILSNSLIILNNKDEEDIYNDEDLSSAFNKSKRKQERTISNASDTNSTASSNIRDVYLSVSLYILININYDFIF